MANIHKPNISNIFVKELNHTKTSSMQPFCPLGGSRFPRCGDTSALQKQKKPPQGAAIIIGKRAPQ